MARQRTGCATDLIGMGMERQQLFDLLEFPLAPAPGGMVCFQKDGPRHIDMRTGRFQRRDVALDQGARPWLLSHREWLLRSREGRRQVAFELAALGAPVSARDFYPALVECPASTAASDATLFLLNTMNGAWVLHLDGDKVRPLHSSALPFLGSCSWYRGGRIYFGGMEVRNRQAGVVSIDSQWCPARPALVSIRVDDHESRLDVSSASIERLSIPIRWGESLKPYALSARQMTQLVPECCMTAAIDGDGGALIIGVLALPGMKSSKDELAMQPMNVEYFGYLLTSLDASRVLSCTLYRHVLGTLRSGDRVWAYTAENRGAWGSVGSLLRTELDAQGGASEQRVVFDGVDASSICAAFQPRFHPRIGYFATAEIRPPTGKSLAHYLQSADGLNWHLVGREGEIPALQA